MKKDSLISFRVSKDLHESLARVAKEDQRSLSSTIEMALTKYLKERRVFQGVKKEKRQYPRKTLAVPAVISQQEHEQMGIGAISEISLGGVKLLISKDFKNQILIDSQGSKFELVFNLPAENKPIRLSCESSRVVDAKDSLHVGAFFVDADFKSYKALQTYLM
ncbi:MAG: PilZ domain-containing protein [Proteobacteria bacterium]|nr:PilZ domain-containing protein [Pseudomonadota bacterium]